MDINTVLLNSYKESAIRYGISLTEYLLFIIAKRLGA